MNVLSRPDARTGSSYSRWTALAAAVALHACLGQAYQISIIFEALSRLPGGANGEAPWSLPQLAPIYTLAIAMLGITTTLASRAICRLAPRTLALAAACCYAGGLLVSAVAVAQHSLVLFYVGYGVLGGVGLGLGYVAPMSMLIGWFPERRGFATGATLGGFGAGAIIGTALSGHLMARFAGEGASGIVATLGTMGAIYLCIMTAAALLMRAPQSEASPDDAHSASIDLAEASRSRAFMLLWVILFVNVVQGATILGSAPQLLRAIAPNIATPIAVAGFVGLLSVCNLFGRLLWSLVSDHLGRNNTLMLLVMLNLTLQVMLHLTGMTTNLGLFVLQYCVTVSSYGGIFALLPSYLADLFGPRFVGGIHGRLLSAWSVGVVAAFALVNSHGNGGAAVEVQSSLITLLLLASVGCCLALRGVALHTPTEATPPSPPDTRNHRVPLTAWTLIAVVSGWALNAQFDAIVAFDIVPKLGLTLLPLLMGATVCFGFARLDRSPFAVRGIVGPYFAAISLLFGLYASLLAGEIWQRINRADALLHAQVSALDASVHIASSINPADPRVTEAVGQYRHAMLDEDRSTTTVAAMQQSLDNLYRIAADRDFFAGRTPSNSAFYATIESLRSMDRERLQLTHQSISNEKLFSLFVFGLLTQLAIALCHTGNLRALSTAVMLFSLAFSSATAILELLDESYLPASAVLEVTATGGLLPETVDTRQIHAAHGLTLGASQPEE